MRTVALALAGIALGASVAAAQSRPVQFVNPGGVRLAYTDTGSGDPVLLIHGFTGNGLRHFERPGVMDALEQAHYRVIAMDVRGHGQSDKPAAAKQYGLEMVRDAVRLLDHLRVDSAHVVGYSMGGAIALQMLVKYPRRVRTLTLIGAGWEGENLTTMTAQMQAMADAFDRRDATALIRGVAANASGGPSDAEVAAATADLFSRNDPHMLAVIARTIPTLWDVTRRDLAATRIPVLAIDGEFDVPNLEAARRMKGIVRDLQVIVVPGTNHQTSVRLAAPPIVAFLDAHQDR